MHRRSISVVVLAACGSPAPSVFDAPAHTDAPSHRDGAADATSFDAPEGADLACLGQPAPIGAPDPLPLDGKVFVIDHYQITPLAGATMVTHRRSDDAVIATSTTTAADGTFAMSAPTGGTALDAYFTITAAGEVPVRIDPGDPITAGYFGLALVAPADEIMRWYADAGATYTADAATLITIAVDCDHASIAGATFTVAPQAPLVYYATDHWDPAASSSDKGYALVTHSNATEAITAASHGHSFPAHAVVTPAATLTLAVASPYDHP